MSLPLVRYQLDRTGVNPDNLVSGESHTLSLKNIRAVAPTYGPFYSESLVIRDGITNIPLVRGTQYKCVELLQEATALYGKEINELILIIDPTVSHTVSTTYQCLGGLYQNNASGIVAMYEAVMNDNRTVNWDNVSNKPDAYPPSFHNHVLDDVYGWEYMVTALERVRNAIVLSNIPAFEELIAWVRNRVSPVTLQQIDDIESVEKVVTFDKLLYSLDKLNFNTITITPDRYNLKPLNTDVRFVLNSTNTPDSVLYWTIEFMQTNASSFKSLNGTVVVLNNKGEFTISIKPPSNIKVDNTFKVAIRRDSINGPIITRSGIMTIVADPDTDGADLLLSCCLYNPNINVGASAMFYTGDLEWM